MGANIGDIIAVTMPVPFDPTIAYETITLPRQSKSALQYVQFGEIFSKAFLEVDGRGSLDLSQHHRDIITIASNQ